MMEVIPKTANTLKMLDPIRFPIDKSFSFLKAAIMEAANSGTEVPKATIETEITRSLKPITRAKPLAASTKKREPK